MNDRLIRFDADVYEKFVDPQQWMMLFVLQISSHHFCGFLRNRCYAPTHARSTLVVIAAVAQQVHCVRTVHGQQARTAYEPHTTNHPIGIHRQNAGNRLK
jgi:hypothetical protein